jgi:hypothetical protein
MDTQFSPSPKPNQFITLNIVLIAILTIIIISSALGINIVVLTGVLIQKFVDFFVHLFGNILFIISYFLGSLINFIANIFGFTGRLAVDIAEGTAHDIGNLLKNSPSSNPMQKVSFFNDEYYNQLKQIFQFSPYELKTNPNIPIVAEKNDKIPTPGQAEPSTTENPIQKPVSSSKSNWCLIGEYQGKRTCIEVKDYDKCVSGQLFPNQNDCLGKMKQ